MDCELFYLRVYSYVEFVDLNNRTGRAGAEEVALYPWDCGNVAAYFSKD